MTIYSKESLETLRQRVDLVEVLSGHIQLQRTGASFKAICPFHEEKSPSFVVQRGESHYHCFGCGAHGDAIAFLMAHVKMGFVEAIESLAERFQVVLEQVDQKEQHVGPSKTLLKQALEKGSKFYHFLLLHTKEGHQALHYLYERGLDLSFITSFEVGYAPKGDLLSRYLNALHVDDAILQQAGLVSYGQSGRKRDFFSDRIMFPIRDPLGAVIGFSGRKYKEETFGGKYINTPETPLFKKSHVLFGLSYSRQKMAKEKKAIIVEGQVDALQLIHSGFNYTVAGQGTAFGEDHVRELLHLGVNRVYLALDADHAGREASVKIGNFFQRKGVEAMVMILPDGSDPDGLLQDKGPTYFEYLLNHSQEYLQFIFNHFSKDRDLHSPSQKNEIVQKIMKLIHGWEQPVMVHESLRKLAAIAQIPEATLNIGHISLPHVVVKKSGSIDFHQVDVNRILEADLIRWLIVLGKIEPRIVAWAKANIQDEHFYLPIARHLYHKYMDAFETQEPCDLFAMSEALEVGDDPQFLTEVMHRKINPQKGEEGIKETLRKILIRHWMDQREKLRVEIQNQHDDLGGELVKLFDEIKRNIPQLVNPF